MSGPNASRRLDEIRRKLAEITSQRADLARWQEELREEESGLEAERSALLGNRDPSEAFCAVLIGKTAAGARGRPRIPDARMLSYAIVAERENRSARRLSAMIHHNSLLNWLAAARTTPLLTEALTLSGEAANEGARERATVGSVALWGATFSLKVVGRVITFAAPAVGPPDSSMVLDFARSIESRFPRPPRALTKRGLVNRTLVRLVSWNLDHMSLDEPPKSSLVGARVRFDGERDDMTGTVVSANGDAVVIRDDTGTEWNSELGGFKILAPTPGRPFA